MKYSDSARWQHVPLKLIIPKWDLDNSGNTQQITKSIKQIRGASTASIELLYHEMIASAFLERIYNTSAQVPHE